MKNAARQKGFKDPPASQGITVMIKAILPVFRGCPTSSLQRSDTWPSHQFTQCRATSNCWQPSCPGGNKAATKIERPSTDRTHAQPAILASLKPFVCCRPYPDGVSVPGCVLSSQAAAGACARFAHCCGRLGAYCCSAQCIATWAPSTNQLSCPAKTRQQR